MKNTSFRESDFTSSSRGDVFVHIEREKEREGEREEGGKEKERIIGHPIHNFWTMTCPFFLSQVDPFKMLIFEPNLTCTKCQLLNAHAYMDCLPLSPILMTSNSCVKC